MSLRIPIRSKGRQSPVSNVISRPAPVKGWNARDPIAAMKPDEAITLENWYPSASDLMLRKGVSDHVTGISGQVESLMAYNTPAGTQTLFAAAGASFYNASSAGAVGAAVVSGLTNSRWQHLNYTNSSGTSYLCCFNGVDSPRYWDNSSWITITGASTPAITGLTPSQIVAAAMHKRRMWLVQKDSLKAWYLPVDAVGGAANALDLSGIAKRGGYIMAIDTWTLDAGEGVDDYWVAVTSEGEVIVYAGTDPSSADTWKIKGVWLIGEPIGRRCLRKFGGDLLLILVNGVYPLSKALLSASVDPRVALTNRIEQAMNAAAAAYSGNFGWQVTHYPAADMLLLNVPVNEGSNQRQYVMNVISGAWCEFTGYSGNCFEVFGGDLYMGGSGAVSKVWTDFDDNDANITGEAKTAFDYFGARTKKAFKMVRPTISTNGSPTVELGMDMDYDNTDRVSTLTFTESTSARWGVALWGIGRWGSGLQTLKNWIGVSGLGLCAATRFRVASKGIETRWQATDYLFEPGSGVV
jgi:hypothetical protein